MTDKITTKVNVTLSENFDSIIILMNASFAEDIKKNEYFFEELGRQIDIEFRDYKND